MNDSSGDWSTLANWNSGQTPIAPVDRPGTGGARRNANAADAAAARRRGFAASTVRPARHRHPRPPGANITVTLSTGTHNIRKLYVRETLNITGGSLDDQLRAGGRLDADVGAVLRRR